MTPTKNKKLILLMVAALAAVYWVVPDTAFAQAVDPETGSLMKSVNELFDMVIHVSSALLWPVILMIGSLLDNELIFGGAMGDRLLSVWDQIRDLVNIIFVLVLLAIALYNVLGFGEGEGSPLALKQALPKFVIALIAVNFSFLAAKVTLDFTNVITGAVFALPATVSADKDGKPINLDTSVESIICGSGGSDVSARPLWCDKNKLNERAKAFFSRLDRSNITIMYAIRFGRAPHLKYIRDGLEGFGQLGFNIIFNAVLFVVYAVSFIALFLVLLIRLVALWIGVVLSPLLALGIALPNLKELAGEGGELRDRFVNDAIAPIKIGLILSIGYIMLDGFEADKSIHGDILSSTPLDALDPNALPTSIENLQQLMIAVGSVAIVWTGVFAAAEKTSAKGITGFIKTTVGGFGKFMAKLPAYPQIIPVGGGKKMSLADVGDKLSGFNPRTFFMSGKQKELNSRVQNFRRETTPKGAGQSLGTDLTPLHSSDGLKHLAGIMEKGNENDKKLAAELRNLGDNKGQLAIKKIFASDGQISKELKRDLGQEKDALGQFENQLEGLESGEGKAPEAKEKEPVETSVQVANALKGKDWRPSDLSNQKPFGTRDTEAIKTLRTSVEKLPENLVAFLAKADMDKNSGVLSEKFDAKMVKAENLRSEIGEKTDVQLKPTVDALLATIADFETDEKKQIVETLLSSKGATKKAALEKINTPAVTAPSATPAAT